jgi:hypothetical protein
MSAVPSSKQLMSCDLCGFKAELKVILVHHIVSRHKKTGDENEFKCATDGCNKTFKGKNKLYQHRYYFHKKRDPKVNHNRAHHKSNESIVVSYFS